MDNSIMYIPITELIPGEFQPRLEKQNDNLDNLTNSIKNYGILVPLIVRPKDNKYEIILGNRRYKAALSLGIEKVPVMIFNIPDDKIIELIISDNVQREYLTAKEEASLYEKALEYPDINSEKLSINLGIPLDRITSKLNLLKKEKPQQKIQQEIDITNSNNYINENNSINNDIINLSELNKEGKEREDLIMNNNEFMNNDINTNQVNNQGVKQQTPTFGGRFFPSLEDEPTNMNLGVGFNNINTPSSESLSPLIDLTDLSTESPALQPTPQINTDPIKPIPSGLNQQPAMPELNPTPISQPEFGTINLTPSMEMPQQPMVDFNIPTPQAQESIPTMDNNINIPNIDMSQHIPDFNTNITPEPIANEIPTQNFNLGQIPTEIPGFNINQVPITPPVESPIPQPEMDSVSNINQDYNLNNNQMTTPIDYSNTEPQKDVLPVVNMIKNLAINIESLGYKINITESDDLNSYKINIEVEK